MIDLNYRCNHICLSNYYFYRNVKKLIIIIILLKIRELEIQKSFSNKIISITFEDGLD
jgi:hypothetical protein